MKLPAQFQQVSCICTSDIRLSMPAAVLNGCQQRTVLQEYRVGMQLYTLHLREL